MTTTDQPFRIKLPKDRNPLRSRQYAEESVEGEIVLHGERWGDSHTLNATAAAIWWLCDGRRQISEIAVEIAELYGVDADAVLPDVEETLRTFTAAGVLRWP